MSWPPIPWGVFSWEAFATLATGFAAVASATWVAVRQIDRTQRYFDAEQYNRKQAVRMELLEIRTEIISDFRKIFFAWSPTNRLDRQDAIKLYALSQKMELVFPSVVHEETKKCASLFFEMLSLSSRMEQGSSEGEIFKRLEQRKWDCEDQVMPLMEALMEELVSISRIDFT